MISREYIPLFIGLLVSGLILGFYWLYRVGGAKRGDGRWSSFGSWSDYGSYFGQAYRIVIDNRGLFLFPLGFFLLNRLITLGILSFNMIRYPGNRNIGSVFGSSGFTITQALSCLKQAVFSLDFYFSEIFGGYGIMIIVLVCLCCYPLLIGIMKKYRIRRLGSLIRILNRLLWIVLALLIPFLAFLVFWRDKPITIGYGLVVTFFALPFLLIYFKSLIESGYLVAIRCVMNNQALSIHEFPGEAIKYLKPLFGLNIILALPVLLGQIPSFIYTMRQYMPYQRGPVPFAALLAVLTHYLNLVFALALLIAPLLLIVKSRSVGEALWDNFRFIKDHPVRYLVFVLSGAVFFFIIRCGGLVLNEFVSSFSYWRWLGETVLGMVALGGGVIYSIALFGWVAEMESNDGQMETSE